MGSGSEEIFRSEEFFKQSDNDLSKKTGKESIKRRIIPITIGAVGVALMGAGILVNYVKLNNKASDAQVGSFDSATESANFSRKMIKVDVSGSVVSPGVYEIPSDSRIQDVLISAGGISAKADRTYIAKNINLAQHASDGMKIYIPEQNEVLGVTTSVAKSNDTIGISVGGSTNTSLIGLNSGTPQQLDSLPGVGPVTANKIIAGRPYQNISELIDRKIVGRSIYDKIKDKVSLE